MSINSTFSAVSRSWNTLSEPAKVTVSIAAGAVASAAIGSFCGIGGFVYLATTCAISGTLAEVINRIVPLVTRSFGLSREDASAVNMLLSATSCVLLTVHLLFENVNCLFLSRTAIESLKTNYTFLGIINATPLFFRNTR